MKDNDKLVNFKAPEETVEIAKKKLDHGEMSEVLRSELERVAHGAAEAEQTRVKDQLQELREEKRAIEEDIRNKRRERDEKDRKIERLEERLDALANQDGQYDGVLTAIETQMHNDAMHVFEDHGLVSDAAEAGNCSKEQVLSDLRERNPNLPDEMFSKGGYGTR